VEFISEQITKMVKFIHVGSSINLSKRFSNYYNYNFISKPQHNMLIYKALLKYGYSKFSLEILEYCNPSNVIEREQHYIDLLNPEYNVLPTAGSSLGHKHREETLIKFKNRVMSEEHKAKLRKHLSIFSSSIEHKKRSKEHMKKINKLKGIIVEVLDT